MENLLIQLSEDGKRAMNDNEITYAELENFTDEDIKDLFKSFRDRMAVRQYVKTLKAPTNINCSAVSETDSKDSDDAQAVSTDLEDTSVKPTHNLQFSADELLLKRSLRGKSSPAQKYFNNLLKHAAIAAKLWKRPYPNLEAIPRSKKEIFFNIIEETVPGVLSSKKKDVWRRLGEHLQNRRKYLNDKEVGKRQLKSSKSDPSSSSSGAGQSAHGLQNMLFNAGDIVMLKDKDNNKIARAIFLQCKDAVYSEVVIKSILSVETDMELPEKTLDGKNNFKDVKIKTVITYWTKYISKFKEKEKSRKLPRAVTVDTDSDDPENMHEKERTASVDMESQPKQKVKSKSDHGTQKPETKAETSTGHNTKTTSIDSDSDIDSDSTYTSRSVSEDSGNVAEKTPKRRKNIQFTSGNIPVKKPKTKHGAKPERSSIPSKSSNKTEHSKGADIQEFDSYVLMEWQNGRLFWGIKSGPDDNCIIQNCVKPCGKITEKMIDFEAIFENSQNSKLSLLDIQALPDMGFCIMNIEKKESNAYGLELTDSGTITLDKDFKEKFINKLKADFMEYISEVA